MRNYELFRDAILKNNINKIKEFINQGINVNFIDNRYNSTPLITATINSNLEVIELLLQNNADITIQVNGKNVLDYVVIGLHKQHTRERYKQILSLFLKYRLKDLEQLKISNTNKTLLEHACYHKWIDIVELLVQHNVNVNIGQPLLSVFRTVSSRDEDITVLSLLLKAGADLKNPEKVVDKSIHANSLLHFACYKKDKILVEMLINYGIDLNIVNRNGLTPLSLLCSLLNTSVENSKAINNEILGLIKLLIKAGADINLGGALAEACKTGNIQCVKLLLKKGANINGIEYMDFENTHIFNKIPIVEACKSQKKDIVELLIKHGADVNHGYPLSYACRSNNKEIVELLLQAGADVNMKDEDFKYTSLMHASANGNLDIVKLLIKYGADVNIRNQSNETALILATKHGHEQVVKFLFQQKADINVQSARSGQTALFYLIKRMGVYSLETIEMFLQNGAEVNIKDIDQKTPIFYAVKSGNLKLFNLLLKYGADINVISQGNKNLLYYALESLNNYVTNLPERIEIVRILLKLGLSLTSNNYEDDYFLYQNFLDFCESGNVEIVSLFVKSGINVNFNLNYNYNSKNALLTVLTKIVRCIENNDEEKKQNFITIAKMLIYAGADIPPECKDGGFRSYKYTKEREVLNTIYKMIATEKIFNEIQSNILQQTDKNNQWKKIAKI